VMHSVITSAMHSIMTRYMTMLMIYVYVYVYVHLLACCTVHARCDRPQHEGHGLVQCYDLGPVPATAT
jgi:hypothetical protein